MNKADLPHGSTSHVLITDRVSTLRADISHVPTTKKKQESVEWGEKCGRGRSLGRFSPHSSGAQNSLIKENACNSPCLVLTGFYAAEERGGFWEGDKGRTKGYGNKVARSKKNTQETRVLTSKVCSSCFSSSAVKSITSSFGRKS